MPALRGSLAASVVIVALLSFPAVSVGEEEDFTEELLLRPLPDRKVLAHFHFRTIAAPGDSSGFGRHHHVFPKAVAQLVQKFHIQQLELSFTQGRWNYERWGGSDPLPGKNAKPPGVELWTLFNLPNAEINLTWKNLTNALSGLFCASINFLESTASFSSPHWAFGVNKGNLRYGALPREAVCTENLTPWLKLLPCRDKAGIASLMDRPSIYKGYYHSQRLQITATSAGTVLVQTLTVVLQPDHRRDVLVSSIDGPLQPNWSLSSLFQKQLKGNCVLAKSSSVYVEIEGGLSEILSEGESKISPGNQLFKLSPKPHTEIKEIDNSHKLASSVIYAYNVTMHDEDHPLDVGIVWNLPLVWQSLQAPYHSSRHLMGSGNERGSIAISLLATKTSERLASRSKDCSVQAVIFQVVPWYVKVYYHTLRIFVDGLLKPEMDIIKKIEVTPSEDKLLPGTLELLLEFPCSMRFATLTLDFDKGFLHIDEYPPDANQGFDIPSALVSFLDFQSNKTYSKADSPLLLDFKVPNPIKLYTEVLLVPLTTPDFSMPYNVITFTSTVLALYFGSLMNVLRRRVGDEERLSKKGKKKLIPLLLSKLSSMLKGRKESTPDRSAASSSSFLGSKQILKLVVVAAVAVALHYFWNDG